jgi:hypothetical protein
LRLKRISHYVVVVTPQINHSVMVPTSQPDLLPPKQLKDRNFLLIGCNWEADLRITTHSSKGILKWPAQL